MAKVKPKPKYQGQPEGETRSQMMNRTRAELKEAAAIFAKVYRTRYEDDQETASLYELGEAAFKEFSELVQDYGDFSPFDIIGGRPWIGKMN